MARVVQPQFENRSVRKTYVARVHGVPAEQQFECHAAISSVPAENGLRLLADTDGLPASTSFRLIRRFDDETALVEVSPLTGRTNQIRLHLWSLGHPIVGDPAYLPHGQTGSNTTLPVGAPPLCLHALKISLHDQNGELREFSVPLPDWAQNL